MLHVDMPSPQQVKALARYRRHPCVTIVLPTTPVTPDTDVDRLQFRALTEQACEQLERVGAEGSTLQDLREAFDDLIDDDDFWRFQAHSLVVYATPDQFLTYRLPTQVEPLAAVADRFHLKPLLRATSFENSGYVLALADGGARLIEVSAALPAATVNLPDMPTDAASTVGKSSINDRSPSGRLTGSEGKKVRLRQYARAVERVVRERLAGEDVPLVLASVVNLGSIYRSVNTYPHLAAEGIEGNPERTSDSDLAQAARPIFDGIYQQHLEEWRQRFHQRSNEGRATTDIAQVARAATFEAVQSLLVDMDQIIDGRLDATDGRIHEVESPCAGSYSLLDEIARRVLLSGGDVLVARKDDMPDASPVAAILRYAL